MTESHERFELDESRVLGGGRGSSLDPKTLRGAPKQRGVTEWLGRGQEQELLGVARQRA
jgi:hypothetical protein